MDDQENKEECGMDDNLIENGGLVSDTETGIVPTIVQNIGKINIDEEMKKSYIDYAMAVIVGRALPDVRDGLKPVHRRILYAMYNAGFTSGRPYKKCARIVGDVLGQYHPHGDSSVYDALVRMAQDFSMRYEYIDGQGNYGSVDGDNAAAMRYTEARMSKISMALLEDIEKETVDFAPNFDESLEEPTVLPSRLPGLLLNGTSGIAVGMATNIPPHNLGELVDGICHLIDDPEATVESLMEHIHAPDFPTAGLICGVGGVRKAYETGRGSVIMRARVHFENSKKKGKESIIVTELPYQVNKANLVMKIAELVQDKKINGISDLRDESDRKGMRIYIELKRDASKEIVLNLLYKHTQLQQSFGVNMVALVKGIPKTLTLKEVLSHYIDHRKEVIVRRTRYDLKKAEARLHILEGLKIALDNIDAIIALIKKSPTTDVAREGLRSTYNLSERQANAILEMRLQRLTGLEREKIETEYNALLVTIEDLKDILANEPRIYRIIKEEQQEIKEKFNDKRRSEITEAVENLTLEDLIPKGQVAILISKNGFVKRMAIDTFRSQQRGGRGVSGMTTRDTDVIEHLLITSTHDTILFFSTTGRVFKIKAYELPEVSRQSKGVSIAHFLHMEEGEFLSAAIDITTFESADYLLMCTKKGVVKKTEVAAYKHFKNRPIIAINLDDGDVLKWVQKTDGNKDIVLTTTAGMLIRFEESQARPLGRASRGVRGIKIRPEDELVCLNVIPKNVDEKLFVLTITKYGYGKNIRIDEFKCQNRAGIGVKSIKFRKTLKDDCVKDTVITTKEDEIMIVTKNGTITRQKVKNISTQRRSSQGVTIMKMDKGDEVIAMTRVEEEEGLDSGS